MKTILTLNLFLILLCSNSLFAQENELEPVSIQFKWFYQYQFAGFIMAKEKGFYEREGLDVTLKERDPTLNNIMQVINGDSQYGLADSVIFRYRAQGHPVKVIASIFQHNPLVLISKKGSGILSPFEMKGKRIAYQEGLDDSVINSLFKFGNLKQSDVIKFPMDFSHMEFVNGDVDITEAYLSIEPYWMKTKYGVEVNIIDPKNYGIDLYGDLLFTTEKEIKKHPDRVAAIRKATLEGWQYALEHKEETIRTILKKYNTRDLDHDRLSYEADITKNLIAANYIPLGEVRQERFKILIPLYMNKGIPQESLNKAIDQLIYNPNRTSFLLQKYLYPIVVISMLLLILILLLVFYNNRLSHLVKQRTKELEQATLEAELASESKSAFLANMSHEIRTPMNAILGFVEQLSKHEKDPERQKMFKTIETSSQALLTVINDVLDISKLQSGKMTINPQECDLHKLFLELEELFYITCEKKQITFRLTLTEDLPKCALLDDIRLKQVITNLLSNAIKFTPEHGNVRLDAMYDEEQQSIYIFVADDGVGIAKENIDKIFNVFEQEDASTTRRFGGTGLGLTISKQLIEMMEGEIDVSSTEGDGSRFLIRLPYHPCSLAKNDDSFNDPQETQALQGHILIVEDNLTNQMLLRMILDDIGLSYEIANNGQEALDHFSNDPRYDLILMDENMPVMNGIEAVKAIRSIEKEKELAQTPIIAVTANALSGDKERFVQAGMNDYLAKPYNEKSITAIISKHLR